MAIDYTKWRVDQIRTELIKLTGMSIEEAELIKGKSQLLERLIEAKKRLGILIQSTEGEIELEGSALVNVSELEEDEDNEEAVEVPKLGGHEWQDYVISLLQPDEYVTNRDRKFPKATGLRRVAQIVLGPIIESGPRNVWQVQGQATIVYEVKFRWENGRNKHDFSVNTDYRIFSEIADANDKNTPSPFNNHLSATASSRAEGRALRKALQLNIVTAEEMSLSLDEPSISSVDTSKEDITTSQLIMIQSLAKRLNINLEKALQFHNFPSDIATLSREQAGEFAHAMNRYQGDGADSLEIPVFIREVENA